MAKAGKSGVTTNTPNHILFGAGTIHKNLKYTVSGETGSWNYESSIVGATQGGSKLTITPEITTVEADGLWVSTKGMDVKTGEVGEMEINFVEITKDLLLSSIIGEASTSPDSTFDLIETKPDIEEGDYWDNIAFVGKRLDGKHIIVIMDNALCTSGLDTSTENKGSVVAPLKFKCNSELESDGDKLPIHIYYPKG